MYIIYLILGCSNVTRVLSFIYIDNNYKSEKFYMFENNHNCQIFVKLLFI